MPEPRLGIFWLVGGKLIMESAPISAAEPYGGPADASSESQRSVGNSISGLDPFPADMKYDQPPRGRVMFDTRSQRFTVLADLCILRNKSIARRIMSELKLPKNTKTNADSCYRCSACFAALELD